MKVIVVGAAGATRELLPRLSEMWEAAVVDLSAERLAALGEVASFRAVHGDASSRLVLERAGLPEADALIAASGDDDVNIEACRLAREAGITRLCALLTDPRRQDDYRDLGVPTISSARLTARRFESHLERRRISSTSFADGRAEAIEFRVHPDSPVCGKLLSDLPAANWIIGVILRRGNLIVPHGDTRIEEDDLVTVVGAGADFSEIVRTFGSGEQRFPLDFGKRVAVALTDRRCLAGPFDEAVALVRNSRAASLLPVHRDPAAVRDDSERSSVQSLLADAVERCDGVAVNPRPVAERPARALGSLSAEESVGVIVQPAPRGRGLGGLREAIRAVTLARRTGRPVLLARGTHPYRRILVPALDTVAARAAARAAIDLARFSGGVLCAVAVLDPVFFAGSAGTEEQRDFCARLEEQAAVHGVPVDSVLVRGNPVRQLVETGDECDLLVLGIGGRRRRLTLRAGIAELVARKSAKSVLLVPVSGS